MSTSLQNQASNIKTGKKSITQKEVVKERILNTIISVDLGTSQWLQEKLSTIEQTRYKVELYGRLGSLLYIHFPITEQFMICPQMYLRKLKFEKNDFKDLVYLLKLNIL